MLSLHVVFPSLCLFLCLPWSSSYHVCMFVLYFSHFTFVPLLMYISYKSHILIWDLFCFSMSVVLKALVFLCSYSSCLNSTFLFENMLMSTSILLALPALELTTYKMDLVSISHSNTSCTSKAPPCSPTFFEFHNFD